ncbi:hypothetical protein [Acetobacter sp. P5B1]|uniref:hypothetical protein n=1 Tax=Acetobacter sp. P5B1 TaxID=2762620 RepID=UPI001C03BAF0|nr:hypothetical protein [Acetobacter sp. P5B1]
MPNRDNYEDKNFIQRHPIICSIIGFFATVFSSISAPIYEHLTSVNSDGNPIHLEYEEIGPTNPFALTKIEAKRLPHEFTKPLDDLKIIRTDVIFFNNTGDHAVDTKNTFKPITLTVQKPWEISDIKSGQCKECINVEWKKLDNQTFQMMPTLINPKDSFYIDVLFSTNQTGDDSKIQAPDVKIDARIEGMSSLENKSKKINEIEKEKIRLSWGIIVFQEGWGSIFCIVYIFSFSFLFVYFSEKTIIKNISMLKKTTIYSFYSVICVSSAEAVSTLTIENSHYLGYSLYGTPLLYNVPPIVLNSIVVGLLVYLFIKGKNQPSKAVKNS